MYNGSKGVKGEVKHREKCWEHRGNEQGKGGDQKGNSKGKLRGYFGKTYEVSGRRENQWIVTKWQCVRCDRDRI